jgi:hypothetical protein
MRACGDDRARANVAICADDREASRRALVPIALGQRVEVAVHDLAECADA